jgi:hypothetical protein
MFFVGEHLLARDAAVHQPDPARLARIDQGSAFTTKLRQVRNGLSAGGRRIRTLSPTCTKSFPRALDRFRRPSLRAPWEWDVKRRLRGVEFPVALFDAADALVPGNGGADMIWASALACSGDFLLRLTACQGKDLIAEAR